MQTAMRSSFAKPVIDHPDYEKLVGMAAISDLLPLSHLPELEILLYFN